MLLLVWLAITGLAARAQDIQQEKQLVKLLLENTAALDTLVDQMMRNAYVLQASEAELVQKRIKVSQEKRSWLSSFTMGISLYNQSTSFDEQTGSSVTTMGVLPSLGISMSINPEKLVNVPSNIKIAQLDAMRAEKTIREQRRTLKLFIINKYYEYLEALNVLEMRINAHERQRQQTEQVKMEFERGEADLSGLLQGQNGLANAEEALMKAEMTVLKIKQEITLFTTDSG